MTKVLSKATSKRFRSNFNFGGLAAESDPLRTEAFWDNGDFEVISSPKDRDPRCLVIGRTGSGKSASLLQLEECYPGKVIRIEPEALSLPYITNLRLIKQLPDFGVHLEPFFTALWKHVIIVEVIKHRYNITSPEHRTGVLSNLRERLRRDPVKIRALEYVTEYGEKFWAETEQGVRQFAETFERKIAASAGVALKVGADVHADGSMERTHTQEEKQELQNRFQRVVNETQIPLLVELSKVLNEDILDSDQHQTYLVIDDLDKDWVDGPIANLLIRCLFQAVIDLQRVQYLKIIVALRTNIFEQIGYGQLSQHGQEEKFRGLSLTLQWTRNDLCMLLSTRAEAATRFYNVGIDRTLQEMLPNPNKNAGNPIDYILSRTLLRPRDAILFLNDCVREATGKERITWDNIHQAEKAYSAGRLQALYDEWKDPYTDLHRVLELFRRQSYTLSRAELTSVLDEVALLSVDDSFPGYAWLAPMFIDLWAADGDRLSWPRKYGQFTKLLYDIGFIGIAKSKTSKAQFSYEKPELARYADNMLETACFEVHPAFRCGLDCSSVALAA